MKNIKLIFALFLMLLISFTVSAQEPKTNEIDIKVSSQCNICKESIEQAMAFEKGVVKSNVDLETHTVKVTYKSSRTSPEKIRAAIAAIGYDADDVKADEKAYNNLKDCCKKPEDREFDHSGHDH